MKPRKAREGLTTPGRPLAGGRIPDLGEQDGAVAVSFVIVDRCLGVSRVIPGWFRGEWDKVYNPCRVKTICITAYSIMYNSESGFTS